MKLRKLRWFQLIISLALFSGLLCFGFTTAIGQATTFADPAFQQVWERTDKAVADGAPNTSWVWGPAPGFTTYETYNQSPNHQRLVQYFDKSRMEINNLAGDRNNRWFVTNGLLTVELVTGQLQVGDNDFQQRAPAQIPVGGDPDNDGPTYASFGAVISINGSNRTANHTGQTVVQSINRDGQVSDLAASVIPAAVRYSHYENTLGHNVPNVFWNYLQNLKDDWVFVMGYPISEPYWATFKVDGVERLLLVQLYQRRVLTFNAANAPQWQVEMGNIGQHYYKWRYPADGSTTASLTPTTAQNFTASPYTPIPTTPMLVNTTSYVGQTTTNTTTSINTINATTTSNTVANTTATQQATSTVSSTSTTNSTSTVSNSTPTMQPTNSTPTTSSTTPQPTSSNTIGNGTPTTTTVATVTTPTPTTSTTASGTPTSTSSATATPTPTVTVSPDEQTFLDLINQYRQQQNLAPLAIDNQLEQAAQWMSNDMAANNYFGHTDSKGRNYSQRLAAFNFTAQPQNEVIIAVQSPESAFDTWKNSPDNNLIMLDPKYQVVGIGFASNLNTKYQYYWTIDIAAPMPTSQ